MIPRTAPPTASGYDHNLLDLDRLENYKTNRNQIKVGISLDF